MKVTYYNWSGITLQHNNTLVGFDLFGDAVTWDVLNEEPVVILCVTHGHPEHAGSLRAFLEAPQARQSLAKVHLISSPGVIKHINRNDIFAPERVHSIKNNESVSIDGLTITSFSWVHMPLLPPAFRDKVEYIFQLIVHPIDLIRIGLLGLRLPMNAPQLGFHITYPDGTTVLNYSEGMHRLTAPKEVEKIAKNYPSDMLFFAVEPDDVEAIPRWVKMLVPKDVYLYEAHRPWRDTFHLPFIDLNDYADELSAGFNQMTFSALTKIGQVIVRDTV